MRGARTSSMTWASPGRTAHARAGDGEKRSRTGPEEEAEEGGEGHGNVPAAGGFQLGKWG